MTEKREKEQEKDKTAGKTDFLCYNNHETGIKTIESKNR